ncbi:hypothetical protein IAG25_32610 [Caballeronia sp. EK]|uniref:hypothetical protein n=1 Tax=Caballeronia sp. EK TaxID=2767469 RepID=UPI0016562280|nr:hypothetical protein [Caballeronia sp. EK]MBC8641567.1 hypothetical protein [Caballeronia sp. EK]
MKQFLVCSSDQSISRSFGYIVEASTDNEAREVYLRQVYAKDEVFREAVLDRAINAAFADRFYVQTPQETYRYNETGLASVTDEVIADRVRQFFASKPDLGESYLAYLNDGDESRLNDDFFEFAAVHGDFGGVDALEIAALPKLENVR